MIITVHAQVDGFPSQRVVEGEYEVRPDGALEILTREEERIRYDVGEFSHFTTVE